MHYKTPCVSVVLPTFNRDALLSRSIASVLAQTFNDFELIVVDDASTDSTEDIVKGFHDARIRYERLPTNVGGAEARNVGIRLARGKYIAFQDSDDEWLCSKLEVSVRKLEESPSVGFLFSAFLQVWSSGCRRMPIWSGLDQVRSIPESLLWRNVVDTPTLVVKTHFLDKIGGFDSAMPRYQDWDLALRLSSAADCLYLPDPLVISHVTKGSISEDQVAHSVALGKIYDKNRAVIDEDAPLRAYWLYRQGDAKMAVGQRDGRTLLLRAILGNPWNLRYFAKALLSFPGSPAFYTRAQKALRRSR